MNRPDARVGGSFNNLHNFVIILLTITYLFLIVLISETFFAEDERILFLFTRKS